MAVAILPAATFAQVGNPGFEDSPNFHLWNTYGDAQIEGSSLGSGPIDGVNQALLASATDGTVNSNVLPGTGDTEAQVEAGLGLVNGSLATFNGSGIALATGLAQTVTLFAGEKLSFSWDFLTNQTYNDGTSNSIAPNKNWNDFSFFSLSPSGNSSNAQIVKLADTFDGYVNDPNAPGGFLTNFKITPATDPFISETGYQTFSFTVGASGTYILGLGVAHSVLAGAPDDGVNSGLLLDHFAVAPAPEPATLVGLGLFGLRFLRRRRGMA
ncbi:MAG TPA: hypothetical protein VKT78_18475 [Fimbriimonadaceae bacterium]|nr:hypothetical protein [Fimbriimonadaceae bacterium]